MKASQIHVRKTNQCIFVSDAIRDSPVPPASLGGGSRRPCRLILGSATSRTLTLWTSGEGRSLVATKDVGHYCPGKPCISLMWVLLFSKKKKTQNNFSFIGIFLNYYMYLCIIDFGCGRERWWGIAIYIHVIVNVVLIHAPIFTTSGVVSQFVLDPYRCEDKTHQVNSNFVIWQKHKWIYHVTRLIQWRCVNFV